MGHFPVYFNSAEEGVFKVDKEKNEKVDQEVLWPEHLCTLRSKHSLFH